jgi:hypothetical protein
MTAFNPLAAAANPIHGQQVAAERAQAVAPALPLADRIRALEMALQDVHQRAVRVGSSYNAMLSEVAQARHRVERSPNPDASIPHEVVESGRLVQEAMSGLERERANLLRQWTELGVGWEIPVHGLPHTNPMRAIFEMQRPTPLSSTEHRELLVRRLHALTEDAIQLHAQHVRNPVAVAHRREATYLSILRARVDLLREWNAARLGDDVPSHGVTAEAGNFFIMFQQADRDRILAHS